MPPPLSARASSVAEAATARRFERAAVHGLRHRHQAAVTDPVEDTVPDAPTEDAPYRPVPQERRSRRAAFGHRTGADWRSPYQGHIRDEVIVSAIAPHHQCHSLCLVTPRNLPLAIAASLFQNG
jgi:hypothetical protein